MKSTLASYNKPGGRPSNLSKFSNVTDLLSFQAAEVCCDATVLQVYDAGKWLIQESANRGHWKATSLGRESVNHGFESH